MRNVVGAGVVLAFAAALLVVLGTALGLDLESVALLGGAMGAIVALVPDRDPWSRLGGFFVGFVAAWIGYAVRATMLPDTTSGRGVAVFITVALCVVVVAIGGGRISLWSLLLGTAALAGAYEFTYVAAPPEFLNTSIDTATTLLVSVAIGFLAALLAAPDGEIRPGGRRRAGHDAPVDDTPPAEHVMEDAK